ncbi:hypothetical protein HDU67_000789, partial [Dinochytrium kinnereticum]
ERYSYSFDGNSQALDHIFAPKCATEDAELFPVHVNVWGPQRKISDHDPLVARLNVCNCGKATPTSTATPSTTATVVPTTTTTTVVPTATTTSTTTAVPTLTSTSTTTSTTTTSTTVVVPTTTSTTTTVVPTTTSTTSTVVVVPTTTSTTTTAAPTSTSTPVPAGCIHSRCQIGGPLSAACDVCVGKIIAVDAYCGSAAWDPTCVKQVKSVCGLNC